MLTSGVRYFLRSLPALLVVLLALWLARAPKFDFERVVHPSASSAAAKASNQAFGLCGSGKNKVHMLFGGTSMLGRYIVETWKREHPDACLVNYGRKACKGCDVSVIGDIRDTPHVARAFEFYSGKGGVETVVLAVKPELEGTHWRTFIEVNYAALVEITKLAKAHGVRQLLYTSSIAASSHYVEHKLANENTPQPLYTDYEAPYDLSKRLAEDYILEQNSKEFSTIALRVSGILGGEGDPFFHHRMFPVQLSFNSPVIVDYGFAGNIADALSAIYAQISKKNGNCPECGQFYYYTGEHIYENVTAAKLSELTGKPVLKMPNFMKNYFLVFWQWFRWDHNTYTLIDLLRCANVEQTFDQTKFHKTFPGFKPKYTVLQALERIYKK